MKKFLLIGVMGALLLAGVLIIVPGLLNLNPYKEIISHKVKAYTGRTLTIKGNLRVSFLPTLTVKAEAITLANAPDFPSPDMARIPELEVRVKLLPLLKGQVIVDELSMKNPVFFLEKNAKDMANWQFAAPTPYSANSSSKEGDANGALVSQFSIHHVAVTNATIHYRDGANTMVFDNLNLVASLNKISGKAEIELVMDYADKPLKTVVDLEDAYALIGGKATAGKLVGAYGEQKFSLVADKVIWKNKAVALPAIMATVDDIHAKGSIEVDIAGERPTIKAVLDIGPLDLNDYIASAPAEKQTEKPASSSSVHHWGTEPFNLTWLKKCNAMLQLHTQEIKVRALHIEKSDINLMLADGRLRIYVRNLALYGGEAQVTATVDAASQPVPVFEADLTVSHMNAGQFLKEVVSFKQLEGIAESKMILSTRGKTVKEMISALSGKGNLSVRNGVLRGMNLSLPPEKVMSLVKAVQDMGEQTAFDSASASFTIANGIVRNDDLLIHTPLTDINGTGSIDLPSYQLHYRLVPVQASVFLGGKKLVVLVDGSINDPKMTVDVAQLIPKNKEEAKEALDAIKGLRKNKKMKEELNRLRGILDNVR